MFLKYLSDLLYHGPDRPAAKKVNCNAKWMNIISDFSNIFPHQLHAFRAKIIFYIFIHRPGIMQQGKKSLNEVVSCVSLQP